MFRLYLLLLFSVSLLGGTANHLISLKVEGLVGEEKERICNEGYQHFTELENKINENEAHSCSYLEYTCINIGQRSELFVSCEEALPQDYEPIKFNGTGTDSEESTVLVQYTASLTSRSEVKCEGVLEWSETDNICGCYLADLSTQNVQYKGNSVGDYVTPKEEITLKCADETLFSDYKMESVITCTTKTDLASFGCQTEDKLKEFDNKVAHFEGTLESYVIVDEPFTQELRELALCFWLRTDDKVGSIFSLVNEDHYNALRFDTHTSHIHFTMGGLHTDHGLVPPIALKDRDWRYFCANWNSTTGEAKVILRKKGADKEEIYEEVLPLSKGRIVKATGGKLALGNLWKEDVVEMEFNEIGSLEGDVMGLTLFNTTVDVETFNQMFEGCSTVLDQSNVVLSWKDLLDPARSTLNGVAATFGQQVCSEGYTYGRTALRFDYNQSLNLSNNVQNYAKIENAFSIDLSEFTICTILKSDVRIGTIFSYVTTVNGFKEEIVLEKHKTHMHFYMAGIDQQVGAVPKIPIDTKRWYTTCFTWESNGRWRGYKDGVEVTNENTGLLTHTIGKNVTGGGTCYLGIMKAFNSFRHFRGFGGEITELNLWGKALTPDQISDMVTRNRVHEDDLLVNWGSLLESKRGDMSVNNIQNCGAPPIFNSSRYQKTSDSSVSTLYEAGDKVTYSCLGATVLDPAAESTIECVEGEAWMTMDREPFITTSLCQSCDEQDMFACPEKCIESAKVCDGKKDCDDASDEDGCKGSNIHWIIIGVLAAILVLVLPAACFVKRARATHAEMLRVKRLTDSWEIKREHLELQEKLGEGAFGKVFKGHLLTKPKYDSSIIVAVKELSNVATERDEKMFLEEIRLSKKLGNHPNIVGIVGSIIVYRPYLLILEFVDGGDMLEFLQKNRENNDACITQEDQVFFAWQIANGMEYVSGKNFVHRDLAARNVLISTRKQCKVTDFGLARDLYNYDEYQSEGGRLPIKWMSPEAIFELKFTTESDVWSFGVVMYELFSWGGSPYPGIDPSLLRDRLVNGFRMSAPNDTPDFIYSIMLQCWEFKSADRPSFTEIRSCIERQINHYQPFLDFKESSAAEYVNVVEETAIQMEDPVENSDTAQLVEPAANNPGPSTKDQPGLEYQNVSFKPGELTVNFKNDYKETSSPAPVGPVGGEPAEEKTQYAELEIVRSTTDTNDNPVNVGVVDERGMAEVTRSNYMNA